VALSVEGSEIGSVFRDFSRHPICKVQVFFDFSALVTMLLGFLWLIIHFAEGMFGIAYSFTDDFQRFGHSLLSFFKFTQA